MVFRRNGGDMRYKRIQKLYKGVQGTLKYPPHCLVSMRWKSRENIFYQLLRTIGIKRIENGSLLYSKLTLPGWKVLSGFSDTFSVPTYTPGWREAFWDLSVLPTNIKQWSRTTFESEPIELKCEHVKIGPFSFFQLLTSHSMQFLWELFFWRRILYGVLRS